MTGDILLLAEHKNGELNSITLELMGKGRELADKSGAQLTVLILGFKVGVLAEALLGCDVDAVMVADDPMLEHYSYETYCKVICNVVRNTNPSLFLLGYTYLGIEVGPVVATRLGVVLASNCVDLELLDGTFIVTRPMYGGVIHIRAELQGLPPFIVSLQNGALRAKTLPRRAASLLPIPVEISEADIRAKVVGLLQAATGEIDITKADIIVAVGRGIREKANIQLARDMADALGGVVACSRPLADLGWLPPECHVGMSGKIVKPKVYIACGISGASHHVAGMKDSHTIIAINKDPGAPIFQVAHFGVVRDLFEIMPVLTNQCIK